MFIKNRNNAEKHICLLSTDTNLTNEQIIKTYARRWSIEVNFFNQKNFLGLESGCGAKQYSSIIAQATMVSACCTLLTYIKRCNEDIRSLGAVFEDCNCFNKALNLAYKMISSWFTQQITYVSNFVMGIKKEIFVNEVLKTPKPLGLRIG